MDAPASKLYGSPCARPPHQQRNLAVITQRCTAPHCHDKADQRLLANTLTAAAAGAELLGCVSVTVHVQQQNVKWRSCCHKATARLRQCMYSRSGCACKSPTHAQHASAGSTTALLVAHSGRLHSRSNNQLAKDSQSCCQACSSSSSSAARTTGQGAVCTRAVRCCQPLHVHTNSQCLSET